MRLTIRTGITPNADKFVESLRGTFVIVAKSLAKKRNFSRFNFDVWELLTIVSKTLTISNPKPGVYNISINGAKLYKGKKLMYYVNYLTYGSRTIRGDTIVLDTFRFIEKNIQFLYMRWRSEH